MCSFNCRSREPTENITEIVKKFIEGIKFEDIQCASAKDNDLYRSEILLESRAIFNKIRLLWRQMEDVILTDTFPQKIKEYVCRKDLTTSLLAVIYAVKSCDNCIDEDIVKELVENVRITRKSILPLRKLKNRQYNKLFSIARIREESSVYQYFHTFLDVQWLLILLEYSYINNKVGLREVLTDLLRDLIQVGKWQYQNESGAHKLHIQPFLCDCVKKMWVFMQLFVEQKIGAIKDFWNIFNDVMREEDPIFSLWLLHHIVVYQNTEVTSINGYQNHILIETKLILLLRSQVEDELLVCSLRYIEPLLNNLWIHSAKIDVYQTLWEYFNKNLSNTCRVAEIPKSARKLIELKEKLTRNPNITENPFEFFTGMLSRHLTIHPAHWGKLKGRIYSRMSNQRLSSLDDNSLYKILLMFVLLADTNFEDIAEKLLNMLENLPGARQKSAIVWNFYIVLITLCIQKGKSIERVANPINQLTEECTREDYHLLKLYINGLELIIDVTRDHNLKQNTLIGSWIQNYMLHCQYSDLDVLLGILILIVEKSFKADAWCYWKQCFKLHVYPALEQVAVAPNATPQIGKLAGVLCKTSTESSLQIITYFCGHSICPKVSARFLSILLEDYHPNSLISSKDGVLIQAWVRAYLLTTENHDELIRHVSKLQGIPTIIRNQLNGKCDVLCSLIEVLGKEVSNGVSNVAIRTAFDMCFSQFDVWVKPYIKEPVNKALVCQIYNCAAQLIYHCSTLLYCKSKSNCLLNRIVTLMLLPSEVLLGKKPHEFVLKSLEDTFHLFLTGIWNITSDNDLFLERIIRELLVHYIPHFPLESSPLRRCFEDESLVMAVLDRINIVFLSQNSKCSKANISKVLQFIDYYLSSCSSMYIFKVIGQRLIKGIVEFLLFNLKCNSAISVITSIATSPLYPNIREDVRQSILLVTEKYLAFYTNNYFELATILVKIIPLDMRALLPSIKEYVKSVEKKRGIGYDKMLRKGFENLESLLV